MKRILFAMASALSLLAAGTGCYGVNGNLAHGGCPGGASAMSGPSCPACGHRGVFRAALAQRLHAHHYAGPWDERAFAGPAGPPTATYGYPYYTVRGPRDFLVDSPPDIGR